jgi:hypothetical protein
VGALPDTGVKAEFECRVTASFLESGRILANAGNCAAAGGVLGILLAHTLPARIVLASSMLCWPAVCYLAVRVAIDASLFRELSREQDGDALDEVLRADGLRKKSQPPLQPRSLAARRGGALRLWKRLMMVLTVQVAMLLGALIVEVMAVEVVAK